MLSHASISQQSADSSGVQMFRILLRSLLKITLFRKFSSVLRFSLLFLALCALYITSSYVLSNSGEETSLEDFGNETGYVEGQPETFKPHAIPHVTNPVIPNELVFLPPGVKFGETLINCGLPYPCPNGEFALHIYTGKDHTDEPRLCLDGKYVLSKDVNGAGRGINVVVVDNVTKTIIKISHFDTYETESTAFETLLLTLRPGDIIILLTFDEPTRKLSRVARLLLFELGSSYIQNLGYRGSWYMVTQKGLTGFSPHEELHVVESNGWPRHHDAHFCVSFQIKGTAVHPDPLPRSNPLRVDFCQKYGDYPVFCDADVVNEPLHPTSAIKRSRPVGKIYNVPIIVMSGDNVAYLPLTLETLIKQSGINPSLVVVFYMPQNTQVPKLCDLFGFMSVELSETYSYCEKVKEAFETANLLFPDAKELIMIAENVVLSPDFLFYMGQTYPLLQSDLTLISISAFNENGFHGTTEDLPLSYRVESFSSIAMIVRNDFFQKSWCSNSSLIDPLFISNEIFGHSIVPEISRVLPISTSFSEDYNTSLWSSVFAQKRSVSYEDNVPLDDLEKLNAAPYEDFLNYLVRSAKPVTFDLMCFNRNHSSQDDYWDFLSSANSTVMSSKIYSIFVHQSDGSDMTMFQIICQCFRLMYYPSYSPRGLFQNVLRFTAGAHRFLAIGSSSPYYRYKPPNLSPIRIS